MPRSWQPAEARRVARALHRQREGRRKPRAQTPQPSPLTRQRLLFLAIVLMASMGSTYAMDALSPTRTFAVASNSMEPLIERGDLVVARAGQPAEGQIVVYAAATGEYQMHRVVEITEHNGSTLYVTRGDANDGDDSFLVRPSDIEGVVVRTLPLVGYAWLVPLAWKAVLLAALLGSYLGITFWDARPRAAATAVLLVLFAPGALAGVLVDYPHSAQSHGVVASPLPLAAGDAGGASVDADLNMATASAPPPMLWKEIPLYGGDAVISVTGTTYALLTEDRVLVDVAAYDPAPTFFLEATMKAESGHTVSVQLVSGGSIAGAEVTTAETSHTWVRSAGFSLAGAGEYRFEAKVSGGTGEVHQVKLIAMQELPVAATVTHVRMSGGGSTSSITTATVETSVHWRFDGASMDGATAYLEVVAQQSYSGSKLTDGHVSLRDITAGSDAATITLADGGSARYSAVATLTDGHEYSIRFRSPDATLGGTTTIHHARLVIEQTALTKTVNYVDLAGRASTSAAAYEDVDYFGRHGGAGTHYFEATIQDGDTLSGTSFARLTHDAAVDGSEVSSSSTSRSRQRSAALELPDNATYRAQAYATSGSTATLYSAWIITHLDLSAHDGVRWDHVLESRVQTPTGTCTWGYTLADVAAASPDRMQRAEVDWRIGAAGTEEAALLPSGRQFTSAVWTGTYAYVFGGTDGTRTDQIVRYDPATDAVAVVATLPTARAEASAVWTGTYAYVFGGNSGTGLLDEIVRFDPATDSVTTMVETLPSARRHTSAAWDGSHAYVFGGITAGGNTDEILQYDPATGAVTTLSATLPTPRYGTSAVWDGTHAYVFGGSNGGFFADIVRFDPATAKASLLSVALPTARYYTSAVWTGTYAYIIGGYDTDYRHGIDRFDPVTGRITTMEDTLPTARYGTSAAWDGTAAYVFGGLETGFLDADDIVRFRAPVQVLGVGGVALPSGRDGTSAVWDGTHAYVFGGRDGDGTRLADIVRYDPVTQRVETMGATLPTARRETSAVWTGTYAFIFGGEDGSGKLSEIVRYDPATDTVTTMSATLPTARDLTAAVWDGTHAYVFGGRDSGALDTIVRYDPATDAVASMTAVLPGPRQLASAVWDGSHAYVFGGSDGTDRSDEIVRYDPSTDAVTTMAGVLPTPRSSMAAAWDGSHAYLLGGFGPTRLDEIVRYDPASDQVVTMSGALPTARNLVSAVWSGHVIAFGGQEDSFARPDDILHYDPSTDVVEDAAARTRQSGQSLQVAPGGTLQSIMDTRPGQAGTTTFSATLQGRCIGYGIHTQQSVTYRFR